MRYVTVAALASGFVVARPADAATGAGRDVEEPPGRADRRGDFSRADFPVPPVIRSTSTNCQ